MIISWFNSKKTGIVGTTLKVRMYKALIPPIFIKKLLKYIFVKPDKNLHFLEILVKGHSHWFFFTIMNTQKKGNF